MRCRDAITHDEHWFTLFCSHFDVSGCRTSIAASHDLETEKVLWTDGACSNNQDFRLRRAGSGIFYGDACVENLGVPLPGPVQTNQRAELFAVVLACLRDPRSLDIRSDSKYVCDGFQSLLLHGLHVVSGDHIDLWNLLAHELRSRFLLFVCSGEGTCETC